MTISISRKDWEISCDKQDANIIEVKSSGKYFSGLAHKMCGQGRPRLNLKVVARLVNECVSHMVLA